MGDETRTGDDDGAPKVKCETWIRLPREYWSPEWRKILDPVVPLRLALYGHPDPGGAVGETLQREGTPGGLRPCRQLAVSLLSSQAGSRLSCLCG